MFKLRQPRYCLNLSSAQWILGLDVNRSAVAILETSRCLIKLLVLHLRADNSSHGIVDELAVASSCGQNKALVLARATFDAFYYSRNTKFDGRLSRRLHYKQKKKPQSELSVGKTVKS